jgi:hypothetical protein
MGLTAGVTGQQGMLTPPLHLILPSHLPKVRVALHSILQLPFDYDYVLHIVNFAILYTIPYISKAVAILGPQRFGTW